MVEAPLDRLPLFVRAGAIVPMGPVVQHTGERPLDEITLLMYPDGLSRFELYEDDGRTSAYRRGQYAVTTFEGANGPGGLTVRIGETQGDRSIVPDGRRYRLQLRMQPPTTVTVTGHGDLSRIAGPHDRGPGWWADEGFIGVRLPEVLAPSVIVTLRTR
jgi:hypothetical protein